MWYSIRESTPKAKKDYHCNACEVLFDSGFKAHEYCTLDELESIELALEHGRKILKGERYLYQFNRQGGDTCTWRCIIAIDIICKKYKLYEED